MTPQLTRGQLVLGAALLLALVGLSTSASAQTCDPGACAAQASACEFCSCPGPFTPCQCNPLPPSTPCDDGDACTQADACDGFGVCVGGPPPDCDDGNACTNDFCNLVLGCFSAFNSDPCEDGDSCTTGEICGSGVCGGGSPVICDDGNVCTEDACDPGLGCLVSFNSDPCDDGDSCTTGEACNLGSCEGGSAVNCFDANACTDDSCDPISGCTFTPNTNPCDDLDACTTPDVCSGGFCAGGPPLDCDDGNDCTDDVCNSGSGCIILANTDPCDDGDTCTTQDVCSGGACAGGPPLDCDDGNLCTDDSCVPASGCASIANTAPCDDGEICTAGDTCSGGSCLSGPPLDCSDGNVCTDDTCVLSVGCASTSNAGSCDDGDACTEGDVCAGGSCHPGMTLNQCLASIIVVDHIGDATASDGFCTLREALDNANSDGDTTGGDCAPGAGSDEIRFAASLAGQTISLESAANTTWRESALRVDSNVTISGILVDSPGIVIERGSPTMRLFYVAPSGTLKLRNLTLTGGKARGERPSESHRGGQGGGGAGMGGAIFNEGTLYVESCTLFLNEAIGARGRTPGGGISARCLSSGGGDPNGGAAGDPDFVNGGPAGDGGDGGFGGGGGGGGCAFNGSAGDGGDGGFGGGGGSGGGNNTGTGTRGKKGTGGFGGADGERGTGNNGGTSGSGAGLGGAIFNHTGYVGIRNSTLSGNTAEGGGRSTGFLLPGDGLGGAVFNYNGVVELLNTTVNDNAADLGGGGIYSLGDADIAIVRLDNSIVANSGAGATDFVGSTLNGGTSTTSGVGNLIESSLGFAGAVVSTNDPNLFPLTDNGGPVATHAFGGASDAIDGGYNVAAAGLMSDGRGYVPRIANASVDIGALEQAATTFCVDAPPMCVSCLTDGDCSGTELCVDGICTQPLPALSSPNLWILVLLLLLIGIVASLLPLGRVRRS